MWLALIREGFAVARCTVERLMRELSLAGAWGGLLDLVRPEAVTVSAGELGPAAGTVVATRFLGAHGRVQVRLRDDSLLLAEIPAHRASPLRVSDQVTATIAATDALAIPDAS